jgi:hypothetical protein
VVLVERFVCGEGRKKRNGDWEGELFLSSGEMPVVGGGGARKGPP